MILYVIFIVVVIKVFYMKANESFEGCIKKSEAPAYTSITNAATRLNVINDISNNFIGDIYSDSYLNDAFDPRNNIMDPNCTLSYLTTKSTTT